MHAAKASLRQKARQTLESLSTQARAAASEAICRRIRALPEWERSATIGLYAPQPMEPDLRGLEPAPGKVFCYPRVGEGGLQFYRGDFPAALAASPPWGLMEPDPARCTPMEMGEIELLLVPGLAFDRRGGRLGRGGGYYDRFLAEWPARAAGVCFEVQLVPEIPREAHDRHVHVVVTEHGVFCEPAGT